MAQGRQTRLTLVAFLLLLIFFLVLNLWMVAPYFLAVIMGAVLATLSYPLHKKLQAAKIPRKTSAGITVLVVTIVGIAPFVFFAVMAIRQGISFAGNLSQTGGFNIETLLTKASSWRPLRYLIGNPAEIQTQLQDTMRTVGARGSSMLVSLLGGIPDKLLQAALGLIAFFFLLIDGKKFTGWLNDKLPLDRDVRQSFYRAFLDTTISVIWASMAAAITQTTILFIAFLVLGVPGAFLAAGATFVAAWLPVVGSAPVWIIGAIVLILEGSIVKTIIMVAFGLFAGVADNIVRPWVLKGRGDLHPLVSLVAIFGGVAMFGLFGVFIGPILTAILLALFQVWPLVAKRAELVSVPDGAEHRPGEDFAASVVERDLSEKHKEEFYKDKPSKSSH